jgi:hypothetical protein
LLKKLPAVNKGHRGLAYYDTSESACRIGVRRGSTKVT